jgi:hypothetical protein
MAAVDRADGSNDGLRIRSFDDIRARAGSKREQYVGRAFVRREDDGLRPVGHLAKLTNCFERAASRHLKIDDEDIRSRMFGHGEQLFGTLCFADEDHIRLARDQRFEAGSHDGVIVRDE